jgi:hypothetical protein
VAARVVPVALVLLVAAAFLPSLGNRFLAGWDDGFYLVDNPAVRAGLTPGGALRAFTTRHGGNWIPVTWLSHMADVSAFGLVPWKHRLVNVALHAANAVLVFALLRRATGALWPAALAAALFAVHPLRVESVVWVAERKDVLSSLFGLLGLHAWLSWVRGGGAKRLAAAYGLFVLSLLAKPMLVTLPALLLLLDWWPLGRLGRATWRARLLEKLPLALVAAPVALVALVAQSRGGALHRSVAPLERVAGALVGYADYLRLAVLPRNLAPLYPAPPGGPGAAAVAGAVALLAAVSAAAWALRRRQPWLAAGWLWYLVALLPVAGLVPLGAATIADRYTYLPLLGPVAAIAGSACAAVRGRPRAVAAMGAAAALLLALLCALTVRQARHWRDDLTLSVYTASVTPPSVEGELSIADARERWGDRDGAERHYRRAVELDPERVEARLGLGAALAARGDDAGAREQFAAAARLAPGSALARYQHGVALARAGRFAEAAAEFRAAVAAAPDDPQARAALREAEAHPGGGPVR